MNKLGKLLLILFSLALSSEVIACKCAFLGQMSGKDIEENDYIALVKVIKVYPVHVPDSGISRSIDIEFKMDIEEIRNYKGKKNSSLVVRGGNYLSEIWTSCDFGMKENQEWLIFGKTKEGGMIIQPCSRTILYTADDGYRDWEHGRGFKQLAFLDSAFNIDKKQDFPESGPDTMFYENGNIERVLHFKKGKRNGSVTYFFPDGKIYGQGSYKKGILDGDFNWYFRSGKPATKSSYSKGHKVDKTINYSLAGPESQPSTIIFYNNKGEEIRFQSFSKGTDGWYLRNEEIYDRKKQYRESKYFYENGELSSINIEKEGEQIENKEFKQDELL
ncbi:hypothetical protein [Algoriphagus yeomjeoni]|uniref:MORN repeat protein n=1 Tax=Algoriphagus yeomjeoni TaxID=291403 RepID=A0A327P4Z8_9BACT|nr:hypothetical protein [Algoriphagus yeomjeoni]RAI85942.1 MORN repeat protein [Algoriphagus yeomjeoni]